MTEETGWTALRGLVVGTCLFSAAGAAQGQQAAFDLDSGKPEPPKLEETIFDVLSVGPTSPAGVSAEGLDERQLLEQLQGAMQASPPNGDEAAYWSRQMVIRVLSERENNAVYAMRSLVKQLLGKDGQTKENMQRAELVWQLLAVTGDSGAMCNIGFKYKEGIGTPKDSRLARQWFERAQAAGCAKAAQALAELGQ